MPKKEKQNGLEFREITRNINGISVQCEICDTDADELYHNTKFENLESILRSEKLRPKHESISGASAISFSKNPKNTVGGNIRLVFERGKSQKLRQMCYVSEDRDKYHDILQKKREHYETLNDNMISTEIGLQSDNYKKECEVYSEEALKIGDDIHLKRIEAYIPWRNGIMRGWAHTTCKNSFPKYAKVRELDTLTSEIDEIRGVAQEHDTPFRVESCFPYLRVGGLFPKWYKLDGENLQRLTEEKEPLLDKSFSNQKANDLSQNDCKC